MSYKITDTIIVDQSKNINSIGIATFAGPLIIGGGTSTGTVSQTLQINNSGAYIAGDTVNGIGLGIGVTNPAYPLDIRLNGSSVGIPLVRIQPTTVTRAAGILYANSAPSNYYTGLLNSSGALGSITGLDAYGAVVGLSAGTTPLIFVTNNTEALRITSSQNVGIGLTNPTSKLQVSGDIYNTGIHTAYVLNASKDPGTGIATDFTNSLFGNGWRLSSPASTTYYKLATLPYGGSGSTFDHLIISGVLGAWTNTNQTPFEIFFSNRGAFNYKYTSYGSVRSDVKIVGISTNNNVEIWAQHQASQFTKLVYNITNSVEAIVVSNPTSTTTAPTGTTVFDSSTATPRFIINESDNVGIGTINPTQSLHVQGNARVTGAVYDSSNSSGTSGQVLQSTATGTQWVNVTSVGAVNGITVRDEGTTVGTAGSVTSINFVGGNIIATASGVGATITIADNLVGTGLSITGGISTVGFLTASNLYVSGISTFAGITTHTTSLFGTQASFTGVVTATAFYGSGANLTNIPTGSPSISTVTSSSTYYPTFVSGTSTTGFGITSSNLSFIPSSGNLGLGATTPSFKADIAGDARVQSTGKMRFGGTAGTTNFYIQYNSTANSLDFVAG